LSGRAFSRSSVCSWWLAEWLLSSEPRRRAAPHSCRAGRRLAQVSGRPGVDAIASTKRDTPTL
jgi:hypothetical protein